MRAGLRREHVRLIVRLARAYSHPSELRMLLRAALPDHDGGRGGGALSLASVALLAAASRPAGPPVPYTWLSCGRPGAPRSLPIGVMERAWPPAEPKNSFASGAGVAASMGK